MKTSTLSKVGSIYTFNSSEELLFISLTNNLLKKDLSKVVLASELANESVFFFFGGSLTSSWFLI